MEEKKQTREEFDRNLRNSIDKEGLVFPTWKITSDSRLDELATKRKDASAVLKYCDTIRRFYIFALNDYYKLKNIDQVIPLDIHVEYGWDEECNLKSIEGVFDLFPMFKQYILKDSDLYNQIFDSLSKMYMKALINAFYYHGVKSMHDHMSKNKFHMDMIKNNHLYERHTRWILFDKEIQTVLKMEITLMSSLINKDFLLSVHEKKMKE